MQDVKKECFTSRKKLWKKYKWSEIKRNDGASKEKFGGVKKSFKRRMRKIIKSSPEKSSGNLTFETEKNYTKGSKM